MDPTPLELLHVCGQAARAGASQLLSWRGRFQAREKSSRDLITDADLASEQAIRQILNGHFPEHGVLGEEAPAPDQLDRPYCWVVDPLDGTTNYAHGLPCYAVSVAVARHGEVLAGVVLDPERNETFSAAAGEGAWLNGLSMKVSGVETIDEALTAVSFPPTLDKNSPDLQAFLRVVPVCLGVRRTGSAALNLAYVACGRLDAHWAHQINPWDSAAGILLVQEAGGRVAGGDGRPYNLAAGDYLTAATSRLYDQLLPLAGRSVDLR